MMSDSRWALLAERVPAVNLALLAVHAVWLSVRELGKALPEV